MSSTLGSDNSGARPAKRPRRPGLFPYYGGKAMLAPWIVDHLPSHTGYCEPFCGGARVLFAKPRARVEVINDLDRGVYTALKITRDHPEALAHLLSLTAYGRDEHRAASQIALGGYDVADIEAARAFMVMVCQQMSAQSRLSSWRMVKLPHGDHQRVWARIPEAVMAAAERLQGVAVENRPAADVIDYLDHEDMCFYIDPPYHPGAADPTGYMHHLARDDHRDLADLLRGLRGMVVLSGYDHPDYESWFEGWSTLRHAAQAASTSASGARRSRTEVLWFNPAAWHRLQAGNAGARTA